MFFSKWKDCFHFPSLFRYRGTLGGCREAWEEALPCFPSGCMVQRKIGWGFWRADADDVFQEVFLAYFQCGKHFQEEEHRRAWLLRTTLNFSRRVTSSPWRRRVVPLSERADAPVQFQTPEQTGLWSALSSLPDGLRVPLYLFYFEELSTQEIARLLSLRPGAVRMRLSRGREHLRELLKGDYFHE